MKQENEISILKEKIRRQTRLFGKTNITGEIALYVLMEDYKDTVEQVLGYDVLRNLEKTKKKIKILNDLKNKKSNQLIIDHKLEQAFCEVSENGCICDFVSILFEKRLIPSYYFESSVQKLLGNRKVHNKKKNKDSIMCGTDKEIILEHCIDLTYIISKREDMFYGREEELEQLISILLCRQKRNAILIGEPGVGKTAIVEALTDRIRKGKVPKALANFKLLSLNLASLIGGASGRGDFEERVKNLINNLECCEYPIILFIDEFHSIVGLGNDGNFDLANLLKPILARNKLSCIGATTYHEYKLYIEKDGALIRRFQNVYVSEPTIDNTFHMLCKIKRVYEDYHKVIYEDAAIKACVELTDKYVPNRRLPDKALDVMDEAGVMAKRIQTALVTKEMVEELLGRKLRIPIGKQEKQGISQFKELEQRFSDIIGHQLEKEQLKKLIFISQIMPESTAMVNNIILFQGNNDTGKEKIIQALKDTYFPMTEAYMELDLNGYQEKHMLSKLIGAPPGYIGSQDSGILLDKLKKTPRLLLVLKNISDAHSQIIDFLCKVLQGSKITDINGNSVRMKNSIVVIDNCGNDIVVPSAFGDLILGTIQFHKLNSKDLRCVASECFETICNELRKYNVNLVIHNSVTCWLDQCATKIDSEKDVWRYVYQKAIDVLYDFSVKDLVQSKGIELYLKDNNLKYKLMEE